MLYTVRTRGVMSHEEMVDAAQQMATRDNEFLEKCGITRVTFLVRSQGDGRTARVVIDID